jgi:hypothetical protein
MRHLLRSLALLVGVSTSSLAQDARPTVLVYPFGMTTTARAIGPDAPAVLASRAVEGVVGTNRFAAINESANAAIKAQIDGAMTLTQFESAVQIRPDKQLQSKYLLTGFIQGAKTELQPGRGNERIYEATISAIIQIYNVETREVMATRELVMRNGFVSGARVRNCSGWVNKAKCAAEDAARATIDAEMNKGLGGTAGDAIKASTPQEAVESALRNASAEITKLLNETIK